MFLGDVLRINKLIFSIVISTTEKLLRHAGAHTSIFNCSDTFNSRSQSPSVDSFCTEMSSANVLNLSHLSMANYLADDISVCNESPDDVFKCLLSRICCFFYRPTSTDCPNGIYLNRLWIADMNFGWLEISLTWINKFGPTDKHSATINSLMIEYCWLRSKKYEICLIRWHAIYTKPIGI